MKWLLDTNTVLYLLGGRLASPLAPGEYCLSVISEMELLSYPSLDERAEQQIRSFLSTVSVIGLSDQVREAAIRLRRQTGLRLPDAIVAATAVVLDAEVLTNDLDLLRVAGLRARSLPLKGTS